MKLLLTDKSGPILVDRIRTVSAQVEVIVPDGDQALAAALPEVA